MLKAPVTALKWPGHLVSVLKVKWKVERKSAVVEESGGSGARETAGGRKGKVCDQGAVGPAGWAAMVAAAVSGRNASGGRV